MKKVLLTAMALLTIASASAFGMYGNNSDWIDFLVHGNQFRARMNQLGFTLGNGTIKGTFGFKGDTSGAIIEGFSGRDNNALNYAVLKPTISAGIGYTSPVFGIGVGYNYTMLLTDYGVHTPVLTVNALNDNLRIAVPVQIGIDNRENPGVKYNDTVISMDPQIRYYTGIDALSHIRLTIRYGMASSSSKYSDGTELKTVASSFGFEFRIDFLKTMVGNVEVSPFFRVKYNTALEGFSSSVVAANPGSYTSARVAKDGPDNNLRKPYDVTFELPVGLGASSDIVSLYLEPRLGYSFKTTEYTTVDGFKHYGAKDSKTLDHSLVWGAYAEIYITPVKDLEWYFEADVGNGPVKDGSTVSLGNVVNFATSTGITWYLPSLGGNTAE